MKTKLFLFVMLSIFVLFGAAWVVLGIGPVSTTAAEPMTRKIVVFQPWFVNQAAQDELINQVGGIKIKNLDLIGAKAIYLPSKAAERALNSRGEVLRIDDDVVVEALGKPTPPPAAETLPWGVDRIDADLVWGVTTGDPIKVAVLDTGIDLTHPDLQANIKGSYNTINPTKSANDDNGHGTHVAGIIGALDNTIGIIGVGPQIDLYAVKVLSRSGSGYLSDIIEGLDWAIQNGMQVVNMSLGTNSDVQSFHDAVIRVNQAGIAQVAAAGNDGGAVDYPAAYPEVIAVSATSNTDAIASWSSRGPEVDLTAPGVNIYSTYKGKIYKTLSGTSMAAPHIAGTVALLLSVQAKCDFNLDGKCSPTEVQQRLENTAEDLGANGNDNLYGAGLVDAEKAVSQ